MNILSYSWEISTVLSVILSRKPVVETITIANPDKTLNNSPPRSETQYQDDSVRLIKQQNWWIILEEVLQGNSHLPTSAEFDVSLSKSFSKIQVDQNFLNLRFYFKPSSIWNLSWSSPYSFIRSINSSLIVSSLSISFSSDAFLPELRLYFGPNCKLLVKEFFPDTQFLPGR